MMLANWLVLALTQMLIYSASGTTTYGSYLYKDSTRCSTHSYQTTLCSTISTCCRTPYGQSMRISGTCSNLKMTTFYQSNDCTGKFSSGVVNAAKWAAEGCKNDALFHSRKTTCVDAKGLRFVARWNLTDIMIYCNAKHMHRVSCRKMPNIVNI